MILVLTLSKNVLKILREDIHNKKKTTADHISIK